MRSEEEIKKLVETTWDSYVKTEDNTFRIILVDRIDMLNWVLKEE